MVIGPSFDPTVQKNVTMSDNWKISAIAGQDIPTGVTSTEVTSIDSLYVKNVFWNDADFDYIIEITVQDGKMTSSALSDSWMKHVRLARHCHMQNLQIMFENDRFFLQSTQLIRKGETLFAWFNIETSKHFKIPFLTLKNIKGGHHYSCHQCNTIYEDPNPLKIHLAYLCPSKDDNPRQDFQSGKGVTKNKLLFKEASQAVNLVEPTPTVHSIKPIIDVDFLYLSATPPLLSPFSHKKLPTIFSNRSAFKPLKSSPRTSPPITVQTSFDVPTNYSVPNSSVVLSKSLTISEPQNSSKTTRNTPLAKQSKLQCTMAKPCTCSTTFQPFRPPIFATDCLNPPYFYITTAQEQDSRLPCNHNIETTSCPVWGQPRSEPSPKAPSSTNDTNRKDDASDNVVDARNRNLLNSLLAPEKPESKTAINGIISEKVFNADGKSKRRHKCYYCGKMYSRKYGLKIHIRTHTGYKPLKCKVCLRPFGDPSNLNKHIRLHAEGITPYRCELCGKVLVRRRDLERHLKSRHPNHTATNVSMQVEEKVNDTNSI